MAKNSMRNELICAAVAAWLALVSLSSEAANSSTPTCVTPKTMASVWPFGKAYKLVLTVENPSAEPLELVEFYLGENMLDLRAVPAGESKELALTVPLLSPGPRPLVVAPFEKVERTYQLAVNFPELEKTLENKDVLVSWQLTLKGDKMCFSQKLASSVWLPRRKGTRAVGWVSFINPASM